MRRARSSSTIGPGSRPWEQQRHRLEQQTGVAEVASDGLVDPGVLDLDRDGPAVVGHGAVHLADRGCGDRRGVPLGEQHLGWGAELLGDDLRRQLRRHRRRILLELGERVGTGSGRPWSR